MSNKLTSKPDADLPMIYHIRIKGHLGTQWIDWFGGATITLEANGETRLTCLVVDQAALYSVLRRVFDLGMPLISVNRIEPDQSESSNIIQ